MTNSGEKGFIDNKVSAIHLGRNPSKGGRPPKDMRRIIIDVRRISGMYEREMSCRVDEMFR